MLPTYDLMEHSMVDDDINAGAINEKMRGGGALASDGEDRATQRLRKLGTRAENVDQDRLGRLPSELFNAVTDNIDDIKVLENLSLTRRSYHHALGRTVKDISHRKYTKGAAAAIYDSVMRDGIPAVSWQETMPELMGDRAQPHAATADKFARTLGPIIRYLDDDRQGHFAAKIVAASPAIRGEVVDGMVNHMNSFKPEFRKEIFDAVIDDFENEQQRFGVAGTLEDATLRKNLTLEQLNRVSDIRVANPEAQEAYRDNVRFNDGTRFAQLRAYRNNNSRTQLTDSGAPYGVELTSDALKYNADQAGRLDQFAVASKALANDAKTARGDLIAAREIGDGNERGR
jgi:hypothetical protein